MMGNTGKTNLFLSQFWEHCGAYFVVRSTRVSGSGAKPTHTQNNYLGPPLTLAPGIIIWAL